MKRYQTILGMCAAMALAAGCASKAKEETPADVHLPPERELNEQIVAMNLEPQARAATVASRTIYPHDFVAGGAALNLLGERRYDALVTHGPSMPTEIIIPRGDASDALYEQRLAMLRKRIADDGIAADRITFADKLPAGDGITSDRANLLAAEEQRQRQQGGFGTGDSDYGFGSTGYGGSNYGGSSMNGSGQSSGSRSGGGSSGGGGSRSGSNGY